VKGFPEEAYKERVDKLRGKLEEDGLDSFIVFSPHNIRYLCGFSGSSGVLIISRSKLFLITDFRYAERAELEAFGCEIRIAEDRLLKEIPKIGKGFLGSSAGFESDFISYKTYVELSETVGSALIAKDGYIDSMSMIKDNMEIEKISTAVGIADSVFNLITSMIRAGVSERDISTEIEYFVRKRGAEKTSFDTIVASGARSSMPHASTSDRVLKERDLVIIDFGALYDGYVSDMTRTLSVGSPDARQNEIYDIVLRAQEESISKARAGMLCSELDRVARDIIAEAGYGSNFGHSLGHSLGMRVHENPRISPNSDVVLEAGMVVTIEPGIYIPGWGGIRIEDVIVITDGGCRVLTRSPKSLFIN